MAVIKSSDGSSTFVCEEFRCGFTSSGWDTEEQATARGEQHANEHATGELMQELTAFEADNGFKRPTPEDEL